MSGSGRAAQCPTGCVRHSSAGSRRLSLHLPCCGIRPFPQLHLIATGGFVPAYRSGRGKRVGEMHKFKPGVAEKLKHYVYRLVDPRDGSTFYVGKGTGDRVFNHVNGMSNHEEESEKHERIVAIRLAGLQPIHLIHRHSMEDEATAHAVEAAIMDSYPGLTNVVVGHGTRDFGLADAEQLNRRYAVEEVPVEGSPAKQASVAEHREATREVPLDAPVVTIKITQAVLDERGSDVYETVRRRWVMSAGRRAMLNSTPHYVLAILKQQCIAVYAVGRGGWKPDPKLVDGRRRYYFTGEEADKEAQARYVGKRYSDGAQFPVSTHGF